MAGPFKDIFARLRKKPSQPDQEIEIRLNRLAELRDRARWDEQVMIAGARRKARPRQSVAVRGRQGEALVAQLK